MYIQKRKILFIVLLAVVCIICFGCLGCDPANEQPSVDEKNILISQSNIEIEVYEDGYLKVVNSEEKPQWSSSNENVVSINEEGYYLAKSQGTSYISAKIGEKSATCKIVVSNSNYRPTIETNIPDESLNLTVGDTFNFNPTVNYNGKTYSDAQFDLSDCNDIISIKDGVITALKKGNVDVEIAAKWHGFDGELKTKINVNVTSNVFLTVNKREILLGTSDYTGENTTFTLKSQCIIDNQIIDKQAQWSFIENNQCVELDGDVLTSKKEGQTKLQGKVVLDDNSELYTPIVSIKVNLTTVEIEGVQNIDYDQGKLGIDLLESLDIKKIYDNQTEVEYDAINDKISNMKMGERSYRIITKDAKDNDLCFTCNVKVVKKIRTASEFVNIFTNYGNNPTAQNGYKYEGYFELANNIDATGEILSFSVDSDSSNVNQNGGFNGVFDGKGYTISNLTVRDGNSVCYGIFGQIAKGSVVKNVAFVDLKGVANESPNHNHAALAFYSFGVVENVMIKTDSTFVSTVRYGGNGASFKNLVVYAPNYYTAYNTYHQCNVANALCYSDFKGHIIEIESNSVITVTPDEYYPNQTLWKALNVESYMEDLEGYNPAGVFDENIWLIREGKLPCFKSSYTQEVEIFKGKSLNLATLDKESTFTMLANYQGVSLTGTVITISKDVNIESFKIKAYNSVYGIEYEITVYCADYLGYKPTYEINGNQDFEINLTAFDVSQIIAIEIDGQTIDNSKYLFDSGKLDMSRANFDTLGLGLGDYSIKVNAGDIKLVGNISVVTKVIMNADELINLQEKYGNNATASNNYQYGGYFVLGANINADGKVWNSFVDIHATVSENCGFTGIFDGRGFTISNLKINKANYCYGVFGSIAKGAVIRNVAFVNLNGSDLNNENYNYASLAYYNFGTVENVYISTDSVFISTIRYQGNAKYKNLVVYAPNYYTYQSKIHNCIVGNAISYSDISGAAPSIDFNSVITVTGDEYYANPDKRQWMGMNTETYLNDLVNYDAGLYFTEDIWLLEDGKLPCFKSSVI